MIKVDRTTLDQLEQKYPDIGKQIFYFEQAALSTCAHCGSADTADVQCGVIGRTIHIATATTKFKLTLNRPEPGTFFCNRCDQFFD